MTFDSHLQHLLRMALIPGWRDHARYRAKELEATYPGLTEAVRSSLEVKRLANAAQKAGV